MSGSFITASDVDRIPMEGAGNLGPISTSSPQASIVFVDLVMGPGDAFPFHHHPEQEEVIYVVAGTAEAWIGQERRTITAGDTMHVPAGVVHACFNDSEESLTLFAVLTPKLNDEEMGFSMVDTSGDEPWASLR